MVDRWTSQTVVCKGGLILNTDVLTQGTAQTGSAKILQNYEPSLEGGYSRVLGYSKYDDDTIPGSGAILGVKVGLEGVFAARSDDVYYSQGGGWSQITSPARTGAKSKYRFISYALSGTPVVTMLDGVNPAAKYDGSTYTLLNGLGAPTDPKYALVFLSRLMMAGYSSNPYAVTISAPGDDEDYDGGNGAIELNVGDIVVGLKTFREVPYIFCQNSIWKITGSTADDFVVSSVTKSIGCVASDSIQEVGGDLVFLAPDGLRSLAATARIGDVNLALLSQQIQPLIRPVVNAFSNDDFSALVVRRKSQYRLFVYDSDLPSDLESQGFLGKLSGNDEGGNAVYEWATLQGFNVYSADSEYSNNSELVVFGHPTTGYVYQLEAGADLDGVTIEYIYKSPDITFQEATLRKVLQKITVYTQVDGAFDADLFIKYDGEAMGTHQPPLISMAQDGDLGTYGTAIYNTSIYDVLNNPIFKKSLIGSGFTASVQFSGVDSNPPHRIDSYQIEYALKGRR